MRKNTFFDQGLSARANLEALRRREYFTQLCEQAGREEIDLFKLSESNLEDMCSCLEEEVKRKEALIAAKREGLRVRRMRLSAIAETGSPTG